MSRRKLVVTALAEADLQEARDWYEGQRTGLGDEFVEAVGATVGRIQAFPHSHAPAFLDLRAAPVRRFPYLVIYRLDSETVFVVAMFHGARDPGGWQIRK